MKNKTSNKNVMPGKKSSPRIKNEKQYEALKDKGYSKQKAARIANTDNAGKKGAHGKQYEDRTKTELQEKARQVGIKERSKMSKQEFADALRNN